MSDEKLKLKIKREYEKEFLEKIATGAGLGSDTGDRAVKFIWAFAESRCKIEREKLFGKSALQWNNEANKWRDKALMWEEESKDLRLRIEQMQDSALINNDDVFFDFSSFDVMSHSDKERKYQFTVRFITNNHWKPVLLQSNKDGVQLVEIAFVRDESKEWLNHKAHYQLVESEKDRKRW